MPENNPLLSEVPELKRQLQVRDGVIATQALELSGLQRQIDHLKLQIAKLRRFRFGQSSELGREARRCLRRSDPPHP